MKSFLNFTLKVIVVHTVTYFIAGIISSNVNDYETLFKEPIINNFMRSFEDPLIMFGPLLQPIRGLLYAIVIFPFRNFLHEHKNGWLMLWGLFLGLAIFGTCGAAPGSLEGVIFSKLPFYFHLVGLPEITLQTLVFSIWLMWWDNKVYKKHLVQETNK